MSVVEIPVSRADCDDDSASRASSRCTRKWKAVEFPEHPQHDTIWTITHFWDVFLTANVAQRARDKIMGGNAKRILSA